MDLFSTPNSLIETIDLTNGTLLWSANFLATQEADHVFAYLQNEVPWQQESINLFGRQVAQPRLQAWYGDAEYTYSGLTMQPLPWSPLLLELKQRCEAASGTRFNSVLANLYRDGQDSMGWHQDNEPELGRNPVIASLNLGDSRRFVLKHKHNGERRQLDLHHGSLLIMSGETQHFWRHCVPKTAQPKSARINLTFRQINSL